MSKSTHLSTTFSSICTHFNIVPAVHPKLPNCAPSNTQHMHIVGGLEEDKHPILTFPEVGLKHLDTSTSFKELNTTLLYLKTLMRLVSFPPTHLSYPYPSNNSQREGPIVHIINIMPRIMQNIPGSYVCKIQCTLYMTMSCTCVYTCC